MTRKTDAFRAMGIINTYDLLTRFSMPHKDDLVVSFYGADLSRGGHAASTQVWSPYYKTNPKAAWYQNGNHSFHGGRDKSFAPAVAWAAKQMKIKPTDLVPNPIDPRCSVVHKAVRERAFKALAEWQAKRESQRYGSHCLRPDTCNPDKPGGIGCVCECKGCIAMRAVVVPQARSGARKRIRVKTST